MFELPEIPNADFVIPLFIIGCCGLIMAITWALTRSPKSADDLEPIVGQAVTGRTEVTQAELGVWHRAHGATVQRWIENHEDLLHRVSDDGLAIDLSNGLASNHHELGPAVDEAISSHPAHAMRAELSALVSATRGTVEALRRSNWSQAESEHLSYLEYRDTWLTRLRQFTTAESQARQLEAISQERPRDLLDPDY